MRKLRGGQTKETRKQRQERKEENLKIQQQMKTIVLPTIGVIFLCIVVYVFLKTRPRYEEL
ncbi:single-pass membrane and coiled-coil domain-containing protein 4 homolog [Anopheles arabiensis]|uniref:Single-pass membrane and coiled-coil domain-containing protein 4 homolog n=3 Tax=gambiae species complex TaxID=44542 RepID=SMCO4_ANOGA|nr:single-pass membrane and coiled-coil domain-containing protein 4 homolog [Anopheles arabiensis]XP_040218566.1 single-pass membrane and coiled-coil domain-containing protein 4 homolog [Anopheles coluzzii]XP_061499897.1 single-pass membrane and coiled-coil domain-containing protein 4 homolog [Anopheles gambiae]Q7PH91.3 RecName: Full=Single-pass membrane and coiled-coil domain-containing protein 4 homolog [Anopheles gambiae]EAA44637.3 AGAP003534-PA [Anopheles gambiae str. PEST]